MEWAFGQEGAQGLLCDHVEGSVHRVLLSCLSLHSPPLGRGLSSLVLSSWPVPDRTLTALLRTIPWASTSLCTEDEMFKSTVVCKKTGFWINDINGTSQYVFGNALKKDRQTHGNKWMYFQNCS
jgi:hypothetical protein